MGIKHNSILVLHHFEQKFNGQIILKFNLSFIIIKNTKIQLFIMNFLSVYILNMMYHFHTFY